MPALITPPLKYKAGYKYQCFEDYTLDVSAYLKPWKSGGNNFVHISLAGMLHIMRGYAWDGASGPAIDTENWRTASLLHDALYQLIREGYLQMADREAADQLMFDVLLGKGMWTVRAALAHGAVSLLGELYMNSNKDEVLIAP